MDSFTFASRSERLLEAQPRFDAAMVARHPITCESTFRKWCANAEAIEVLSVDEAYPGRFHTSDQAFTRPELPGGQESVTGLSTQPPDEPPASATPRWKCHQPA
jgi:hypothetical protein